MIDYIQNLLKECDYSVVTRENNVVFMRNTSQKRRDYYCIYDLGKYESIKKAEEKAESLDEIFYSLSSNFDDAVKNTTAIYLWNIGKMEKSLEIKHFVLKLEENSDGFKKNVLYYTEGEEKILQELKANGSHVSEVLDNVKNQTLFKLFKENKTKKEHFSLSSKIFIKLNCLRFNFDPNKEFTDLNKSISNNIASKTEIQVKINEILSEWQEKVEAEDDWDNLYDKLIDETEKIQNEITEEKVSDRLKELIEELG